MTTLSVSGTPGQSPSDWALGPRYLVDLSGRPWVRQLWRPLLPLVSVAGKVYAEPLVNAVLGVVYKKDLFARSRGVSRTLRDSSGCSRAM